MEETTTVLIIGAGPSGLATSACLKATTQSLISWRVESRSCVDSLVRVFVADFLVVASGENSCALVPELKGLDSFGGEIIHSSQYKSGSKHKGKDVLVVGCGNSGMEISLDLSDFGARTSMVVRSAFHVMTKEMVYLAMMLLKYLSVIIVDRIIIFLASIQFGNLSKIGIFRPSKGPFALKLATGKTPVIDNGTVNKILSGDIKVIRGEIVNINGKQVEFNNGLRKNFNAIIFATGYKSRANNWLKDFKYVLNEEGMPKNEFPRHWKGDKKKIYCAGLTGKGLPGVSADAKAIADDINNVLSANKYYYY